MYNQFNYPATLAKQNDGGFLVQFPDFPEAITQGETIEDALLEAADCLEEAIANRIEMKLDIPSPRQFKKNEHQVTPHAAFAAKTALYLAMREQKVTNTSLAKKLNCDEKEVRRLLDPHYNSKLPRIEQALFVLGKRLLIEIAER
ncbi:MAG TPA: type II toxin-antitoxin system HicB family antitoxin [Gammaproteobacteria bacterium]|jgi:antitoxin HicB|nr:type II toxin-antitoxin system HicB family antitoxin [Gammaproteobacteria bacterium]